MSDLIDRQAAIDAMCGACSDWCDEGVCQKVSAIQKLPPAQQWISCNERLPEISKEVLVCYDFKGYRSVLIGALYGDGKFRGYDDEYLTPEGRKYRKAVAWMPLPEPWKGDTQE